MDGSIIEDGEVLVREGLIADVGASISCQQPDEQMTNLCGCVLMPGFVNAHSHIDYTMMRNSRDGLNLWEWLDTVAFNKNKTPHYDLFMASAKLGAAQLALSGVTCLGDSSFTGCAAEAIDKIGLRGIVYQELFGQSMGLDYQAKCDAVLKRVEEMQSEASSRLTIGLSPHSIYTSNPEVLKWCADTGLPDALHLSEIEAESQYLINGSGPIADLRRKLGYEPMIAGKTSARHLHDIGLLRPGVILAHCVHVNQDDIALIAESGASVAHCPRSNAFLGAGIAPLIEMRNAGIPIGIGTDSAGSCGKLDFFEEMRFALNIARATAKDAGIVMANDILMMATRGGAEALGLTDQIGILAEGMCADMIAIDISGALPYEDIGLAVISSSPCDIVLSVVNGEEVIDCGKLKKADIGALENNLREMMRLGSSG